MRVGPLDSRAALWAALAYGSLIYVTLPAGAIAINDDFAYLKSVVQTARVPLDFGGYRTVPFPLNDAEWSALAAGPRL